LSDAQAAAVEQVKMLNQALHIPTLSECGVARGKFGRLADDALAEISTFFNPREATRQDVLDILESAY
jgi:alcohol dehydrogenase